MHKNVIVRNYFQEFVHKPHNISTLFLQAINNENQIRQDGNEVVVNKLQQKCDIVCRKPY